VVQKSLGCNLISTDKPRLGLKLKISYEVAILFTFWVVIIIYLKFKEEKTK